jgi:hypothetical protein
VINPFANNFWTIRDLEIAIFSFDQEEQSGAIQLLKARKIQDGPQSAFLGGMNELIEVRQMTLK